MLAPLTQTYRFAAGAAPKIISSSLLQKIKDLMKRKLSLMKVFFFSKMSSAVSKKEKYINKGVLRKKVVCQKTGEKRPNVLI